MVTKSTSMSTETFDIDWVTVHKLTFSRYVKLVLIPAMLISLVLTSGLLFLIGFVIYNLAMNSASLCKITDNADPICQSMWIVMIIEAVFYLLHLVITANGLAMSTEKHREAMRAYTIIHIIPHPIIIFFLLVGLLAILASSTRSDWHQCCICYIPGGGYGWNEYVDTNGRLGVATEDTNDSTEEPSIGVKRLLSLWYPLLFGRSVYCCDTRPLLV
jgi:hypothetical protein